ncbi:helix-turn-helix domain-containing protein [Tsukamurella paurometabola]|uniref:Carbohydrate diacid transcriptional activator CdaR n=1 Tax=Tsukamurella paurometabola TaxID=2061 RepID=A0A3P8KHV1_TSUPA|nr:helix-turn-helix domain-containing protein [Tsukamurella paurometabola]MBS4100404.1 helix-turn-helix domain-containing protein [Tsukamurella paurometabola]UEA82758.1 helix-turn-helix domain-containing protein [Tsukamurella paurometabola]VDR39828.1 carbohydrate diacid transcriptional activator CdaR [Tsukamurella paurometabola]
MDSSWPRPDRRIATLIREVAERMLASTDAAVEELTAAAHESADYRTVLDDPQLVAADRRMNKTNMVHWLSGNLQDPGARVPPSTDPDILQFARDVVRRGLDMHDLGSWRGAQHGAWSAWVDECFAVTTDLDELRELMKVSERSMATFIDDSIAALDEYVEQERAELSRGASAERHATVQLLLEGAPIARDRAEARLGYALTGSHLAAIVWSDTSDEAARLDAAAEALMRVCPANRRLTLNASASALWVWVPAETAPSVEAAEVALADRAGIRVALGRPGRDLEGFRRSHLDALAAQRVLARVGSARRVVRYEDVALISVLTADMAQADQFVADTLGDLAAADAVLRDTALTYVRERFNASAAAEKLYTHRNTVERRLARVDQLLPAPLADNAASVVAALMLVQLRD